MSQLFKKDWLDGQDLMLTLGVCERTLQRWRQKGKLPYKKIDNTIRYWSEDVEHLFDPERIVNLMNDKRRAVQRLIRTDDEPCFSFFLKPISNANPYQDICLTDAYNYLCSQRAYLSTMALRALIDADERRAFKAENFDYVTFGGCYEYRDDKHLRQASGLLCADLDHVADREALFVALRDDRNLNAELLFRSPVDGLKLVVSIDLNEADYKEHYATLSDYLSQCYGHAADSQCSSQVQACFMPYDPQAYLNPKWRKP